MPHIKNALIRYRIIEKCLKNSFRPFPSKQDLRTACEESLFGTEDGQNICDSTIEKDIFNMRMDHDAPIKYNKKNDGYYYEDKDYSINDIPLSSEDLQTIKFAAKTLSQFRDIPMFKQFGFAIDKISDRVNISEDPMAEDISSLVQFEAALSTKGNEFLAPILEAIRGKNTIHFNYTSFVTAKKKAREVLPLLLKEYRNRWYLISYDTEKEKVITFALERMENLNIDESVFEQQIDFDANSFFENAIGITANDSPPETVIFKTNNVAGKYIESQPFHKSQEKVKSGRNKTTFTMKVLVTEELIRSILSYGGEVEIVEPLILREEIINRLISMSNLYKI